MPYKFKPYESNYIDLKSQEINKALYERYAKVLQTRDALQDELLKAKAGPFENDKQILNQLIDQTNTNLAAYAEGTDLENMGSKIGRDVRNYINIYNPIKENYKSAKKFMSDLEKRYEKGEVSEAARLYGLGYVSQGYKGLSLDDNGNIDPNSGFKGGTILNKVDIEKEIREALSILPTEKFGNQETWTEFDPNVGGWKRTNGIQEEWIDASKVREITNQIINKYAMNLSQESDINAYIVESSGGLGAFGQKMKERYSSGISEIDQYIKDPKITAEEKKILSSNKNELEIALNDLNNNINNQDYLKSLYKKIDYSDSVSKYQKYGDKKAFHNIDTKSSVEGDYSTIKARIAYEINNPMLPAIEVQQEVTAADDVSGGTTKKKLEYVTNIDNDIKIAEAKISADNLSGQALKDQQNLIHNLKIEKQRVTLQIEQAAANVDIDQADPKIIGLLRSQMQGATNAQIVAQLERVFDNPNDQDYMDFKADFDNRHGKNSFNKHMAENYRTDYNAGYSPFGGTGKLILDEGDVPKISPFDESARSLLDKLQKKINDKFLETKTSVPSYTSTGDKEIDKALSAYLKIGEGLPTGSYLVETGETLGSADIMKLAAENGIQEPVVTAPWTMDQVTGDIYITIGQKDNPSNSMRIRSTTNQINIPRLAPTLNSTPSRFARLSKSLSTGLQPGKTFDIHDLYVGQNSYTIKGHIENNNDIMYTIHNADGSNISHFTNSSGSPIKYSASDPVLESLLNSPHANFAFPK
ncbi:MAG: hypothetical protein EBU90_09960 [Proteobacteria bacterium]|nr:hypothetical protein [Pseudomonadota bacterium]